MKLVDILLLLTVTTTANAILIPTGNDRSTHTSGTSSRVSDPTNEPDPDTYDEYQEEPMDLSLSNRYRQQPMDQPGSNTPTQNQRPTVIVAGPNIFKQGRKRIIDVIDLTTSDQNQQPIDVAGPSTYKQSRKQPVNHNESSNTVSNQIAVLSGRYQKTFNRIKQMLVESKEIRKKKLKEYCDYEFLRFEQWSALSRGEEISGSKYDPDTEKKLKQEYEKAVTRVHDIRRNLKKFMKRHGLRFEEPKADSD